MKIILTDISTGQVLQVDGRVGGIDEFSLTIRRKDNKKITKSFGSEIEFYDDAYIFLKSRLIDNTEGYLKSIKCEIYDECCTDASDQTGFLKVFIGEIRGDTIDWCEGDCMIKTNVIEKNTETDIYDRLDQELILDPEEKTAFESIYNIPLMYYCNEIRPSWLQYFLFIAKIMLGICLAIFTPLMLALVFIIAIVYIICLVVAAITSLKKEDCEQFDPANVIERYRDLWRELQKITGCGRYHPSPFVRNYIDWLCTKIGCFWTSSILNNPGSPYYNAVYFYAPSKKGRDDGKAEMYEDNIPLKTGLDFLNELCILFNADFWITNGKLEFERKDYFFNKAETWIDVASLGDRLIDTVCYEWGTDLKYAGALINYTPDVIDEIGNEAMKLHLYKEIVDWNTPMKDGQKGLKKTIIPFAPVRVRDDNIEDDILTELGEALDFKDAILISKDMVSVPKMVIWTGKLDNGRVVKVNGLYNYPLYIDDRQPGSTLYKFHKIDNPRENYIAKYNFSFKFAFECSELIDFLQNDGFLKGINVIKGGVQSVGVAEELQVNFKERTIKVTGVIR